MLPLLHSSKKRQVLAPWTQRLMVGANAITARHSTIELAASSRVGGMLAIRPDGYGPRTASATVAANATLARVNATGRGTSRR
ncbi:Uncharacterised protein [Mycobacteroides abscessus subsp. abscessus]|nr:Uncharacterised protein [Mycobacteroides abscessus subsp. abscessus]